MMWKEKRNKFGVVYTSSIIQKEDNSTSTE